MYLHIVPLFWGWEYDDCTCYIQNYTLYLHMYRKRYQTVPCEIIMCTSECTLCIFRFVYPRERYCTFIMFWLMPCFCSHSFTHWECNPQYEGFQDTRAVFIRRNCSKMFSERKPFLYGVQIVSPRFGLLSFASYLLKTTQMSVWMKTPSQHIHEGNKVRDALHGWNAMVLAHKRPGY